MADMEIDIEDGLAAPMDDVTALPIGDDDDDYDGDMFVPKGGAIPENIYEVEV